MKVKYLIVIAFIILANCKEPSFNDSFNLPNDITHLGEEKFRINSLLDDGYWKQPVAIYNVSDSSFVLRDLNRVTFYEFDYSGNLLGRYGKPGRGPDEYSQIIRSFLLEKKTLLLYDNLNAKQTTVSKLNNRWRATSSKDFKLEMPNPYDLVPSFIVEKRRDKYLAGFKMSPSFNLQDTLKYKYTYLSEISTEGNLIGDFKYLAPTQRVISSISSNSSSYFLNENLFKAFYHYKNDTLGVAYIENNSNHLYQLDESGNKISLGEIPFEMIDLSKSEKNELVSELSGYRSDDAKKLRSELPDYKPFYKNAFFFDNHIWLQLNRNDKTKPNWVRINYEAQSTGSMYLPDDMKAISFFNDFIFATKNLESGDILLIGYQIKRKY